MGQPVSVIEKPSSRSGIIRFETNRVLTGMGHERYSSRADAVGNDPADELARRLFDRGGLESMHVNGNIVTVQLATGGSEGIKEIIEDLYTYWQPGMEPPTDEEILAAFDAEQ